MGYEDLNVGNVRIYGGMSDGVYLGKLGTADPTPATVADLLLGPRVGYDNVGWLLEDGIPLGLDASVEEFTGHQGASLLRTKVNSTKKSLTLGMAEDSPLTSSIYWGHDNKVEAFGTGLAKEVIPAGVKTKVFKGVIVLSDDEDVVTWYIADRIEVGEREEISNSNSEVAGHQVSCAIIGEMRKITNAPSYVSAIEVGP